MDWWTYGGRYYLEQNVDSVKGKSTRGIEKEIFSIALRHYVICDELWADQNYHALRWQRLYVLTGPERSCAIRPNQTWNTSFFQKMGIYIAKWNRENTYLKRWSSSGKRVK